MWANTPPDGGLIAVGVEDDGKVTGCKLRTDHTVEVERRIQSELVSDARFETKRIHAINVNGEPDFVLLYRIRYRDDKVVETNKGEAFIRRASSRHLLTYDEVRELRMERGQASFELEPCGLAWPDMFDTGQVADWTTAVARHKRLSEAGATTGMLIAHKLGKLVRGDFVPNNACALLFAKDPQEIVPGCIIRFQRIEGREAATGASRNVVHDIRITGTIPQLIERASETLATHLRTYRRLAKDGRFYTSPEYPPEAWQELIVNACAHRSYSLKGANIFIKMFDDRLVVESPGGFPPTVNKDNVYEVHHRRNWWLMDALFYLDYVQCENEGAKRIRRAMLDSELPEPMFEQKDISGALLRVTLQNNQAARQEWVDADVASIVGDATAKTLDEFDRRIVNFAAEHGGKIKTTQAMNLMQRPRWGTAQKTMQSLVDRKLFEFVSKYARDPRAHYKLIGYVPEDDYYLDGSEFGESDLKPPE